MITTEKENAEKLELTSESITEKKIDELKNTFPEVFTEEKIDFDKLKEILGERVETGSERYGMNWAGKSECIKLIQKPSIGTLKPYREESVNFDDTGNLFIEGDNLEVLKLLQKSYYGKIKVIYIDPPYNTGNDFIYPDNYSDTLGEYLSMTGQADSEGRRYSTNPETDGRFHTKWLNMMYPRLYLARNLLTSDGVIFISIDDKELANLKLAMDEIFGEENIVGIFTWVRKKKGSHLSHETRKMTEFIIAYRSKRDEVIELYGEDAYKHKWQPLLKRTNSLKTLSLPGNKVEATIKDGKYCAGRFGRGGTQVTLENDIEIKNGVIVNPFKITGRYVWTQEKLDEELSLGTRISINSMGFGFNVLRWNQEDKTKRPSTLINTEVNVGTNEDANEEIKRIFNLDGDNDIFSYAKPVSLLKYLIKMITYQDDEAIILDFFAGSGTMAHAVLELNREESKKLKFICIQLPEEIEKDTDAYSLGYESIFDVMRARVDRVIKSWKKESQNKLDFGTNSDLGFKVFKLDKSNFKVWDGANPDDEEKLVEQLELHIDHINPESSDEDILYEIIIKSGFKLTVKVEEIEIEGKKLYSVGDGLLFVSLDKELSKEFIQKVAELAEKAMFVCLDEGFRGNDQLKTNAVQMMKAKDIIFKTV